MNKEADAGSKSGPGASRGRRRLLQGGLGASPLLLTLVSRPVLGQSVQCFTPSGFVSMPTSQHGKPNICRGRTPGYWKQKQHFGAWRAPFRPVATADGPATLFTDVFSSSPYPAGTTFLQVLGMGGGPPNNVARHIVAAVLNVAADLAPVLTIPLLKTIWAEYRAAGFFEPTAGIQWDHAQITAYLESTMPA